jgi:hypothetical protein
VRAGSGQGEGRVRAAEKRHLLHLRPSVLASAFAHRKNIYVRAHAESDGCGAQLSQGCRDHARWRQSKRAPLCLQSARP